MWHIGLVLVFFLLSVAKTTHSQAQETINVLFVNDDGNTAAAKGVETALSYLADHTEFGMTVQLEEVQANSSEARPFLEGICTKYAESLEKQNITHLVLDTTKSGVIAETVKSMTHALALPTISASYGQEGDLRQWRDLDKTQQNYLLQVMPPADMIPEIVRGIANKLNMSNAAILFDETFIIDHKYKSMLRNLPIKHVITSIAKGNSADRAAQIELLRKLDMNNFFVLGSVESIRKVLESADPKYFSRNYAWHAITQSFSELDRVKIPNNAIVYFAQPRLDKNLQENWQRLQESYGLGVKPDISVVFYFDLAVRAFWAVRNMLAANAWPEPMDFIQCEDYMGNNTPSRDVNLRNYFNEVEETPMYGVFELVTQANEPFNGFSFLKFDMELSILNVENGKLSRKRVVSNWTGGVSAPVELDDADVGNSTAEVIHRIYTKVQAPFIMRDSNAPKGYTGFCIDLINEIASIMDFDYELIEVKDGEIGQMDDNGTWNGIVKKLIDKEADIGLGSMSVMAERESVVDFTVPFYDHVGISIMMLKPSDTSSLFKFLTVLERDVWLCILAAYFFTSFLMWIFDRLSPYSYQNKREEYKDDDEKREFDLKECLWFCMTSLTPQGGGEAPKNLSGRLVAATWWLFGFIIIASYTANLAAFLTVSRSNTEIESLDDLSKQYKITYAPLKGSGAMQYFKRMAGIENRFYEIWKDMSLNDSATPLQRSKLAVWDYPVSDKYTKMWLAIGEAGMPETLDEAVARVRNSTAASGFAFLGNAADVRFLVMNNCDLTQVGEEFSRKPYAIAVQQGSHLKDQINGAILQMLNNRALEKLKGKWWANESLICGKGHDDTDGIDIDNIGGVFIVVFMGIGLASVTLVLEYFWITYGKRFRQAKVQRVVEVKKQEDDYGESQYKKQRYFDHPAIAVRSRFKKSTNLVSPRF